MEVNNKFLKEVLFDIEADISEFGSDPYLNSMHIAIVDIIVGVLELLPEKESEGSSGQQMVSKLYWAKLKSR